MDTTKCPNQMTSCLIKAHQAGLGSLLNNVITSLDKYDYVSVDWTGSIYGEGDLWPVLFEPPGINGLCGCIVHTPRSEAGKVVSDTIEGYQNQWLTYKNAGQLYLSGDEWRLKCNKLWELIEVQPHILANVARFPMLNQFRGKVVAALIRAHSHAGEQLSGKSQTLEQYVEAIAAEKPDHVYIACQDLETLDRLRPEIFHSCTIIASSHPFAKRSPLRDIDRHLVEPQTHRDAVVVMEEVLIMSQADVLIHPISNISTACLYMNPKLKSVFLQ